MPLERFCESFVKTLATLFWTSLNTNLHRPIFVFKSDLFSTHFIPEIKSVSCIFNFSIIFILYSLQCPSPINENGARGHGFKSSYHPPQFKYIKFCYSLDTIPSDYRVVSRFLSSRFHPKSRRLCSCYFSNIMLQTDLLTCGVAAAVFGIAGGTRLLPAYFDNPETMRLSSRKKKKYVGQDNEKFTR